MEYSYSIKILLFLFLSASSVSNPLKKKKKAYKPWAIYSYTLLTHYSVLAKDVLAMGFIFGKTTHKSGLL